MITEQSPSVLPTASPPGSTAKSDDDLWKRKYLALKKKCKEYQERNHMLFFQAKKINQLIDTAESETRHLVKKLEQYEEVDVPKCLPSTKAKANGLTLGSHDLPFPSALNNKVFYAAAATRIQTEIDQALAQEGIHANNTGTNRTLHSIDSGINTGTATGSNIDKSSNGLQTPHQADYHQTQPVVRKAPPQLIHVSTVSPVTVPDKPGPLKSKKAIKRAPEKRQKSAAASKRRKGDIDPNAPKKPSNAFFWFCQARRASLQEKFRGEGVTGQHDLTKALAKLWGETNTEEKKPFYEQYVVDKARYDQEMDEYSKMKQATASSQPVFSAMTNQSLDNHGTFTVTIAEPES